MFAPFLRFAPTNIVNTTLTLEIILTQLSHICLYNY